MAEERREEGGEELFERLTPPVSYLFRRSEAH